SPPNRSSRRRISAPLRRKNALVERFSCQHLLQYHDTRPRAAPMNTDVPYMISAKNLPAILDKVQKAGVPDAFGLDFLRDLGYTSSNDRGVIKVLKYLGMLDDSGRPQASYREFVDQTKAKAVLAQRLRAAYDDLFRSDK